MILSTVGLVDENKYQIIGLVTGLSIRSLGFFRQFLGGISSILGGKQNWTGIEDKLAIARQEAIEEMLERAKKMGADDVIGIDVQMSEIGSAHQDAFLVVSSVGTAVKKRQK